MEVRPTPLIVPVYAEGEAMTMERGGLVAVLAGGVRVEGLIDRDDGGGGSFVVLFSAAAGRTALGLHHNAHQPFHTRRLTGNITTPMTPAPTATPTAPFIGSVWRPDI